jgi:Bacterial dnaA protein helix-turn-helix
MFLPESISMTPVIARVAETSGISIEQILGPARGKKPVTDARREAMWLCRRLGFSYSAIGRRFNRDHATVMLACRKHDRLSTGMLNLVGGRAIQKIVASQLSPDASQSAPHIEGVFA